MNGTVLPIIGKNSKIEEWQLIRRNVVQQDHLHAIVLFHLTTCQQSRVSFYYIYTSVEAFLTNESMSGVNSFLRTAFPIFFMFFVNFSCLK